MNNRTDRDRPDSFHFSYLPSQVADYFRDALGCYRHGHRHAFAAMCRLTVQSVILDLGEGARLRIYDQVEEIAEFADLEADIFRVVRDILFETDAASLHQSGGVDREVTAVLLETLKDILHQAYIRPALLRQKLKMRRFFATQSDTDDADQPAATVSPFKRPTGTG